MVTCKTTPILDTISWEYALLKEIELAQTAHGPQVRLTCEDEEQGWAFHVYCDECWLLYLDPYARLLLDATSDLSVERPHIPIYRDSSGRYHFSLTGAEADYPYLRLERKLRLSEPWVRKRTLQSDTALLSFAKSFPN